MRIKSPKWLSIQRWLASNIGGYLLEQEQQQFSKIVGNVLGENFILLGEPDFLSCSSSCTIKNKIVMHSDPILLGDNLSMLTRQDKLAVKCASISVVYLAHSLELADNPHEVLREVYRILAPGGIIVVTGFNPCSLWGGWRLLGQFKKTAPWQAKFLGINKLADWLALLGFAQSGLARFAYVLPINNKKFLAKFAWLERMGQRFSLPFSAAYMLVAKKRILSLTPIPIVLTQSKPSVVVAGLIETNISQN